jgi:RHS repeat-associated protein
LTEILPFGEEVPLESMRSSSKRHFTGHERDLESGLDYMMARYYSLGRFMTVDPINLDINPMNPQSWNKYAYVRNNPVRYTDPRGTMGQDDVGPLPQVLRNLDGAWIVPEHQQAMVDFAKDAGVALNVGSISFAGAALMSVEVPPLALVLGTTSRIMGVMAVGADVIVWLSDSSGENTLVLIADGVAIAIGSWAGDALEGFLMVPPGVGSAADAATGVAVDAGMTRLGGRFGMSGHGRRAPNSAGKTPVLEKRPIVRTRECFPKPGDPVGCP